MKNYFDLTNKQKGEILKKAGEKSNETQAYLYKEKLSKKQAENLDKPNPKTDWTDNLKEGDVLVDEGGQKITIIKEINGFRVDYGIFINTLTKENLKKHYKPYTKPKKVKITRKEIAEKFGVKLENLEITRRYSMKTQTLKSFIKETENEFEKLTTECFSGDVKKLKYFTWKYKDKALKGFLETKLRQAGEVAVEEYSKKALEILDKAELDKVFDMPDTTENWKAWKGVRNSINNLLKEK